MKLPKQLAPTSGTRGEYLVWRFVRDEASARWWRQRAKDTLKQPALAELNKTYREWARYFGAQARETYVLLVEEIERRKANNV